jgi:hypothetical protein
MKIWWIDNKKLEEIPKKDFLPSSIKLKDYPKKSAVVKVGKAKENELCIYFVGLSSHLLVKVKPKRGRMKYSFSGELEGMSFGEMANSVEVVLSKVFMIAETRQDPYEFTLNGILKRKAFNYGKAKA